MCKNCAKEIGPEILGMFYSNGEIKDKDQEKEKLIVILKAINEEFNN